MPFAFPPAPLVRILAQTDMAENGKWAGIGALVITAIGAVSAAALKIFERRHQMGKEDAADALKEYKELVELKDVMLDRKDRRIEELEKRVDECTQSAREAQIAARWNRRWLGYYESLLESNGVKFQKYDGNGTSPQGGGVEPPGGGR